MVRPASPVPDLNNAFPGLGANRPGARPQKGFPGLRGRPTRGQTSKRLSLASGPASRVRRALSAVHPSVTRVKQKQWWDRSSRPYFVFLNIFMCFTRCTIRQMITKLGRAPLAVAMSVGMCKGRRRLFWHRVAWLFEGALAA